MSGTVEVPPGPSTSPETGRDEGQHDTRMDAEREQTSEGEPREQTSEREPTSAGDHTSSGGGGREAAPPAANVVSSSEDNEDVSGAGGPAANKSETPAQGTDRPADSGEKPAERRVLINPQADEVELAGRRRKLPKKFCRAARSSWSWSKHRPVIVGGEERAARSSSPESLPIWKVVPRKTIPPVQGWGIRVRGDATVVLFRVESASSQCCPPRTSTANETLVPS